jgi:AcrR family transcriptional regulator
MSTENSRIPDARDRLLGAAVDILATDGPGEIKARRLAAATGMSTMMVYSTFGGIPGLIDAVRERGFLALRDAFTSIPPTDDPVADLFGQALACREFATRNPHLYDLMFGLSVRSYRPVADTGSRSGHSEAFAAANDLVVGVAERLVAARPRVTESAMAITAQLWSIVHGFVSLEVAGHFVEFDDPVAEVFIPMGIKFVVAAGDDPDAAVASHVFGRRNWEAASRSGYPRFATPDEDDSPPIGGTSSPSL